MTCDAPYNDLSLLQNIETYEGIDSQVAKVALKEWKVTYGIEAKACLYSQIKFSLQRKADGLCIGTDWEKQITAKLIPKLSNAFKRKPCQNS